MSDKRVKHENHKDFYDDPGEELYRRGIYYITDSIDIDSLKTIHQDIILKSLDHHWKNDIQLIVNSPGGYTSEMWCLVDLLGWVHMGVKTFCMGECCSAGAMLVAAGDTDMRFMSPNSTMMIHGPSASGMSGNYHQLKEEMKDFRDEQNKMINFWIDHSKYENTEDVEKYLMNGKDNYFTAEECLDHGIVDHIMDQRKPRKPRSK